jgi:hypothetical protein
MGTSLTFAPIITTFLKIVGAELYGTTVSTMPSLPNPEDKSPVAAFNAISRCPVMKRIRAGSVPSPGQYDTPRRDT